MRLAAAFIAHELRTQGRSLRFRTTAALYLAAGTAPAALTHARRPDLQLAVGGATYAGEVALVMPLLTALFAFLLALDGIAREQGEGAWSTVTLCEVSNAGYLLRRWLALQAVLLPLSALPFLAAAGLALAGGTPRLDTWTFAGPWLLHAAPLAVAASALGLGLGTIGGGPLNALPLLGVALGLAPPLANQLLYLFGVRLPHPLAWLGFPQAMWSLSRAARSLQDRTLWGWAFPMPASEAGFDPRVLGEQQLADGAPLAALAALSLGAAAVYLRRTRPDVAPLRVRPDHPFRGFLASWSRLRERYKPDPAPAPADRLAVAAGLLLAAALVGPQIARAGRYEALAEARLQEETRAAPPATPGEVLPGRWRVEGRIGPRERVAVRVAAEMVNRGAEPAGRLAFRLNPGLDVEAEAPAGAALSRSWDLLEVALAAPIPPGGRRELRFRLSGEPAQVVFPLQGSSFQRRFGEHRGARFSRGLLDLSRSYRVPSISASRVELAAGDLFPVPRYARDAGFPLARVEVSLAAPPGLFLADACGSAVERGEGGPRLAGGCRMVLADYTVAGGRHRLLPGAAGGAPVAVFPGHEEAAELHLGFLARGAGLLEEAWPGISHQGDWMRRPAPPAQSYDGCSRDYRA